MAGLQRRSTGTQLIRHPGRTVALLLALLPGAAATGSAPAVGAQEVDVRPSPGVSGFVEGGATVTRLDDRTATLLTGRLGLHLRPGFRVWAEGRTLPSPVDATPERPVRLGFGYGGVGIAWTLADLPLSPAPGLLVGAGHGRVWSRVTGMELASENVRIVEPSVGLGGDLLPAVAAGVRGGFRWVSDVGKLPGVAPQALEGWTLSFFIRFQQHP